MNSRPHLSLKYRVLFYVGGIAFATTSYILGLWLYGMESASWGDVDLYRQIVGNLRGHFQSHQLSFFTWELVCIALFVTIGYLFDREVHYRRKAEERANMDGLTGIYNHRYFQDRLAEEIARSSRYGRPLSLIMLDIDDFKRFNDTWGHQEGDRLLEYFAALCGRCVRAIDILARYGGEEFIVILPETDSVEAAAVAERIRACTAEETPTALGSDRAVTVSAGIASYPLHDATRHGLILSADAALYSAKAQGKNRCCVYEKECHQSLRSAAPHVKPASSPYGDELEAIGALGGTADAKDPNALGHSESVTRIAVAFGARLGMSAEELANLRIAALLHDIGKIATPRELYEKQGPLDLDEWKQIENHAGLGSRILGRVQQTGPVGPGVKHHHERFDGKGYPNGLVGKNIPFLARVIAIADAYDAMTNPRSYRDAMTRADALTEIIRCAGTQFDPELADEFVKLMSQEDGKSEAA